MAISQNLHLLRFVRILKVGSYTFHLLWILHFLTVSKSSSIYPKLLVISFDGFRHDYLNLVLTPNLHRLMSEGVHAPRMKNAFVTRTLPNHYTILTGLFEESHGIVANEMYDPLLNATFDLNKDMTNSKWWDNGYITPVWLANQLEDSARLSGGMMWPGSYAVIRDMTPFYHVSHDTSISWKQRINIVMSWLTNQTYPANCVFLYFEEPDITGHIYGPNSQQIKNKIQQVDNIIGYLIEKLEDANLYDVINLIVLSDHGMVNVPEQNVIEIDSILDSTLYKKYGGSPVWNIRPVDGKVEDVYKILKNASKFHNFTVYRKKDIPDEYHYKSHRRVMPILLMAKEGWGILHNISQHNNRRGLHGYNNSLPSMQPPFIARGPAFKVNFTMNAFNTVDLYSLMCHILDISSGYSNGSLANVWPMLNTHFSHPLHINYFNSWVKAAFGILGISVFGVLVGVALVTIYKNRRISPVDSKPGTLRSFSKETSKDEMKQLLEDDSENEEPVL